MSNPISTASGHFLLLHTYSSLGVSPSSSFPPTLWNLLSQTLYCPLSSAHAFSAIVSERCLRRVPLREQVLLPRPSRFSCALPSKRPPHRLSPGLPGPRRDSLTRLRQDLSAPSPACSPHFPQCSRVLVLNYELSTLSICLKFFRSISEPRG